MLDSDPFSPEAVVGAFQRLSPATALAQLYSHTLLQQPAVDVAGVPSFGDDLGVTQTVSRTLLQEIEPGIVQHTVAGTLGLGNLIASLSDDLLDAAARIDAGGPSREDATPAFLDAIDLLSQSMATQSISAGRLLGEATAWLDATRPAAAALAADGRAAVNDPTTAELANQLESIQTQIQADNEIIANGLSGTVKEEVQLALAMKDIAEGPVGATKAFVGFILDVASKEAATVEATHDIKTQLVAFSQVCDQFSEATFGVAVATSAGVTALGLSDSSSQIALTLATLQITWMATREQLRALAQRVGSGDDLRRPLMDTLPADLEAWSTFTNDIRSWQQHGPPVTRSIEVEV